jgi:3-oxosteroid 1-dehydrogenase
MSRLANVVDLDTVAWDTEADLVAVGSGIGGLAAAITAQRIGSTAVVLEKTDLIGGVTAYSFGELWAAGTDLQGRHGRRDHAGGVLRRAKASTSTSRTPIEDD